MSERMNRPVPIGELAPAAVRRVAFTVLANPTAPASVRALAREAVVIQGGKADA